MCNILKVIKTLKVFKCFLQGWFVSISTTKARCFFQNFKLNLIKIIFTCYCYFVRFSVLSGLKVVVVKLKQTYIYQVSV